MKAIVEITLKKGCFEKTNGVNVSVLRKRFVKANGWLCHIQKNGKITCKAVEEDKVLRYVIFPSGKSMLTYKEGNGPEEILKEGYVIAKDETIENGTIILSNEVIPKPYIAFFRSEALHSFQKKYGIYGLKRVNPNREYEVRNRNHINKGVHCEIITDGEIERAISYIGDSEKAKKKFPEADIFETDEVVTVKNATWVIQYIRNWKKESVITYRTLYTLKNYKELNIPEEYQVK